MELIAGLALIALAFVGCWLLVESTEAAIDARRGSTQQ